MVKVTILGTGSFGTAIAINLSESLVDITLWGHRESILEEIEFNRTNKKYLEDIQIPEKVKVERDLQAALKDADIVLMIVPSQSVRSISAKAAPFLKPGAHIINFAKGLELSTHLRLSEVVKQEIKNHPISIISGPSHAEEVAKFFPTSVVVASDNMKDSIFIQEKLSNPYFRIYSSNDIIGVEMAGVIKNIIALSAGISDGLGYGDNTKAALITRGIVEMVRIGDTLGAQRDTFQSLAGLGDLVVTATSTLSRNWTFGNKIGKGKTIEQALSEMSMVVEGLTAAKATYELAKELGVEMPITEQVYSIIYQGQNPQDAVRNLMGRSQKEDGFY